jgi:hypothetical protein
MLRRLDAIHINIKICTASNWTTSTRTHDIKLYDYIELRQDHCRFLHRQHKHRQGLYPRGLSPTPTKNPAAAVIFDRRRRLRQDPPPP